MMGVLLRITLLILLLNQLLSPCTALRSGRGNSAAKTDKGKEPGPKVLAGTSGLPAQNITRRGLGISAWGIVAVILTLIMAGMGVYYFVTCYPIFCQKQGQYNMMGLTPV